MAKDMVRAFDRIYRLEQTPPPVSRFLWGMSAIGVALGLPALITLYWLCNY